MKQAFTVLSGLQGFSHSDSSFQTSPCRATIAAQAALAARAMQPTLRLRGKRRWAPRRVIQHAERIDTPPSKKVRQHRRKALVHTGEVPKARRAFALYVQAHSRVPKGSSRSAFSEEMRKLGEAWRQASVEEKAAYRAQSQDEYEKQREAMREKGWQPRSARMLGSVHILRRPRLRMCQS